MRCDDGCWYAEMSEIFEQLFFNWIDWLEDLMSCESNKDLMSCKFNEDSVSCKSDEDFIVVTI